MKRSTSTRIKIIPKVADLRTDFQRWMKIGNEILSRRIHEKPW